MANRPKLTIEDQVAYMKNKGITFDHCSEKDAVRFLQESTYFFKVKAFDKNYIAHPKTGHYYNLDFSYLMELSTLDMRLGRHTAHSFICGDAQLALILCHAANVARRGFGGDGFFFCPLSGQICPTARARLCIGQRTALDLFRADTALIGGVGAGSSLLLAALSGLGFCQFPPLTQHKRCRLFRSRTRKICRFLLSGFGVIFPRGGAGLFLRF